MRATILHLLYVLYKRGVILFGLYLIYFGCAAGSPVLLYGGVIGVCLVLGSNAMDWNSARRRRV